MEKSDKKNIRDINALTAMQEGMLFHYLKYPESKHYCEQLCLGIDGEIDADIFANAWNVVIDANDMLRTVFQWENLENPVQVMLDQFKLKPVFFDLTGEELNKRKKNWEEIKEKDRQAGFNLNRVSFRVTLVKIDEAKYEMIVSNHHILYDGWSSRIILQEFFHAYNVLASGSQLKKPVKTPFKEFIEWQRRPVTEKEKQFWKNYLRGFAAQPGLSIKQTVSKENPGSSKYNLCFDANLADGLRIFVKQHKITLAALLYTAWGILLQRYNSSSDVIFGTTVSGRSAPIKGIEDMVGLFINTLPLRVCTRPGETGSHLVHSILRSLETREPYEHTPLVTVNECSEIGNKQELFDCIVVIENYPLDRCWLEDTGVLQVQSYSMEEESHYDLTVAVMLHEPGNIQVDFSFKDCFAERTIVRLADHFSRIVRDLVSNPGKEVSALDMFGEEEKKRVLSDFNQTAADYPANKTIHDLVKDQAEQTPHHIVLFGKLQITKYKLQTKHLSKKKTGAELHDTNYKQSGMPQGDLYFPGEGSLTYRELNQQSDGLASLLRDKGVWPDTIVAIMLEGSVELIVGIMGILKAGGAYLPIDVESPLERLHFMLKDSSVKILVTTSSLEKKTKEIKENPEIIFIDFLRQFNFSSSQLLNVSTSHSIAHSPFRARNMAYVIYTSGTTGQPKGVLVGHGNAVNTLLYRKKEYGMTAQDCALQLFSPAFDGFVTGFFTPVISGTPVVLLNTEDIRDISRLNEVIVKQRITHFISVPSLFREIITTITGKESLYLKVVTLAGEAFQPDLPELAGQKNEHLELVNEYGVTEAAVMNTIYRHQEKSSQVLMGKPIANTTIYILTPWNSWQGIGIAGELCISGAGVARGYLNNPELTGRKFARTCILQCSHTVTRFYRTGDLARWLTDGNIEFLGRIDHQVKLRGFRIELGEIERCLLKHRDISAAAVILREHGGEDKYLGAFFVADRELPASELREFLSGGLPAHMIPARFNRLAALPVTAGGKIDRQALGALDTTGLTPDSSGEFVSPHTPVEKKLLEMWTELLGEPPGPISIYDNFFDLGGHSLLLIRLKSRLAKILKKDIPMVELFNHPTIASLAAYLSGNKKEADPSLPSLPRSGLTSGSVDMSGKNSMNIAVIGMACRFPGAAHVYEYWENLKNGVEAISFFSAQELEERGAVTGTVNEASYVPAKGVLADRLCFDSFFFGYTPAEAGIMDPQMRIFHQCCWEALEHAGYDPATYNGVVGLYAGASPNPYWQVLPLKSLSGYTQQWDGLQFSDKDYLCTRLGYKLDLTGPCLTLQTACSTSLAAVDQACRGLLSGSCHMALAGGVSITFHDDNGYLHQEGTIMSPDGHCRAFDARAAGTIGGNGAGVVVLKPLETALSEKDTIWAVIKGVGINNDGKNKAGFTAPSSNGQARAILMAMDMAGVLPEHIGYIETHGTGTLLGDPIEMEGLRLAFTARGTSGKNTCALGSVKTNIGHLDASAGIAGLIKAVLALHHRLIPPNLHFENPNPGIYLEHSPFYVNTRLQEWYNPKYPLQAGVNSIGLGGTNVHVVLEEAPQIRIGSSLSIDEDEDSKKSKKQDYQLLFLSAKTEPALEQMTRNLAAHFKNNPGIDWADASYTLRVGRRMFPYRRMLVGSDVQDAVRKMETGRVENHVAGPEKFTVIFMFSGQGSQYVNMGLDLYKNEPVFRRQMDRCFELLETLTGENMMPVLYPKDNEKKTKEAAEQIYQFRYATPLKFSFEYSLATLLMAWGIQPDALIGHSFGEYAAACLAGVFSVEEGLFLAALRGKLMHGLPEGAMLGVPLSEKELIPLPDHNISLAAVNGESLCVVSGPVPAIDAFAGQLNQKGHECIRFQVPKAGHSWMVEPIMAEFKEKIRRVEFKEPKIPYISGMTGKWITPAEAVDPGYWCRHLREPVRFFQGLTALLKEPHPVFLEVGPGRGLTMFVQRHPAAHPRIPVFNLVRHRQEDITDDAYTLTQIGRLALLGIPVAGNVNVPEENRCRIPLPTYPFEKTEYPLPRHLLTFSQEESLENGQSGPVKNANPAEWFYIPVWQRSPLPPSSLPTASGKKSTEALVFFMDHSGLGQRLQEALELEGYEVIAVFQGAGFKKIDANNYQLNPRHRGDYKSLVEELCQRQQFPRQWIHLWGVDVIDRKKNWGGVNNITNRKLSEAIPEEDAGLTAGYLEVGFYSLVYLAGALGAGRVSREHDLEIQVVTAGVQEVIGRETLCPAKAAVLGPVKVIPQEYPHIRCRAIDIAWTETEALQQRLVEQLKRELKGSSRLTGSRVPVEPMVAYRDRYRWVQSFQDLELALPVPEETLLKPGGIYVITGGLGRIGLILARHLARTRQAKLVLTCRSPFPARSEWHQWLYSSSHDTDNDTGSIRQKIQNLMEIEELGAVVWAVQADIAHYRQSEDLFRQVEQTLGPVNGIIHAAGLLGEQAYQTLQEAEITSMRAQFLPKVYGLSVLEKILENRDIDFCLLMSSTAAILGGLGFAAYSAANCVLDASVYWLNRSGNTRWISVNWDGWQAGRDDVQDNFTGVGRSIADLAMTPEEGAEAFERILGWSEAQQVIQSTGSLHQRLEQWIHNDRENQQEPVKKTALRPRPPSDHPYTAPSGPLEQTLAEVWQELLGFEPIGTMDNFFRLGGDSLKAVIAVAKVQKILDVKISIKEFFAHPTIKELSQCITGSREDTFSPYAPVEKKEYYPLSSAQKRMFILNQLEKSALNYNVFFVIGITGEIDRNRFARTFREMIRRHEILRTSFHLVGTEPVQRIHEDGAGDTGFLDIFEVHESHEPYDFIKNWIRPFDLSQAPLLRIGLMKGFHNQSTSVNSYKVGDVGAGTGEEPPGESHLLVVDMHHITTDGISQAIFVTDFIALYNNEELSGLRLQYKDYASGQYHEKTRERLKRQEAYWTAEFNRSVPVLRLPLDFPRPAVQGFEGGMVKFTLPPEETGRIKTLALTENTTLFMVLLAVYGIFLSRLSGQEELVIGAVLAGRRHVELEAIMGMFVNTLPLRLLPIGSMTAAEYIRQVKTTTLEALENQDYPFEELLEKIHIPRDLSRNPLFDAAFTLQNMGMPALEIPGLHLDYVDDETLVQSAKFDLSLTAVEKHGQLIFSLEYCSALFKNTTIRRFTRYFRQVLLEVSADANEKIAGIEILPLEEKKRILEDFNDTGCQYPAGRPIHELFAGEAKKMPDHIVLVGPPSFSRWQPLDQDGPGEIPPVAGEFDCQHLSYRELSKRSARFAGQLIQKGVHPGSMVGIMMERSVEMIIAILAILEAGAAYLPIDPGYPEERIAFMLKDSSTKVLITTNSLAENVKKLRNSRVKEDFRIIFIDIVEFSTFSSSQPLNFSTSHSTNPAYVIYTSGSSGRPRGVMVEHASVVRLVKHTNVIPVAPGLRLLFTGALVFDISVFEMWFPLLNGLTLFLTGQPVILNAGKLAVFINRNRISVLHLIPQLFNQLVGQDIEIFRGLSYFLVGGDVVRPVYINRLRTAVSHLKILHMYGPTENTTFSTFFPVENEYAFNIPIGKPITNSTVYILSAYNNLQPIGVMGEICVGGHGIARGYLNNPELTSGKFVHQVPAFISRQCQKQYNQYKRYKIYKTGDLGQWLPEGNILFLGRLDFQVKIRGFRIELGEIENQLLMHKDIKESVVTARTDRTGDPYLCAYIVSGKEFMERDSPAPVLRRFLSRTLPDYMIPAYIVCLEKLPLTANGKIDRNALPEPETRMDNVYTAPTSAKEKKIVEIWQQVLGLDRVGIHDHFFDVGGNSLKVIRLCMALTTFLGKEIPAAKIFRYPTAASFAAYLDEVENKENKKNKINTPGLADSKEDRENHEDNNGGEEMSKIKQRLKQKRERLRS